MKNDLIRRKHHTNKDQKIRKILKLIQKPHFTDFPYFLLTPTLKRVRKYDYFSETSYSILYKNVSLSSIKIVGTFLRSRYLAQRAPRVITHTKTCNFPSNTSVQRSEIQSISPQSITRNYSSRKVLLIYIDGLSPSLLKSNLFNFDCMPYLASLFGKGFLAERFFSASEWTLPNLASMFLGVQPLKHKLSMPTDSYKGSYLQARHINVFQHLRKFGVKTNIYSANPYMNPNYGLHLGSENLFYKKNAVASEILQIFREQAESKGLESNDSSLDILLFMDVHHLLDGNTEKHIDIGQDVISVLREKTRLRDVEIFKLVSRARVLDSELQKVLSDGVASRYDNILCISDHGSARLRENLSLCLDDARTKSTLAITNAGSLDLNVKKTIGMVAVPSIITQIFGIDEFPSLWNFRDGIAFSHSTYPDLPFRLKIRTDDLEFNFRSENYMKGDYEFQSELISFLNKSVRDDYPRIIESYLQESE